MEDKQLKVFVIVVTYNGMQWYDRCFTSLRNSTIPVQTIVVDNASGDGTVDYIKENYSEIHLIESKENLGFGKGNNLAMRYALDHGCDYVFLLNQDAWIEDADMLGKLVLLSLRHPEYGVISPMHIKPDKQSLNIMIGYGANAYTHRIISDLYCGTIKEIYQTNYVNATAWLLPRNTLSVLGGFDPLIFHYGEDDDYLHRMIYHKLKIGVCLSAFVVHDHQGCLKDAKQLQYFHDLNLLVDYLDINHPFSIGNYLIRYIKKWLVNLCNFNLKRCRSAQGDLIFLLKMAHEIKIHRKENMHIGETWL